MLKLPIKFPIRIRKKYIPFICLAFFILIVFWFFKTKGPVSEDQSLEVVQAEKYAQQKHQGQLRAATSDFEIARIYHSGIPDRYVGDSRKAHGVPPDAKKALQYYQSAIEKGDRPGESALEMASIYLYGTHNFEPQPAKALSWYTKLYTQSEDDYLKGLAYEKLIEIEDNFPSLKNKTSLVRGHHEPNVRENFLPEELFPGSFPVSHDPAAVSHRQPWGIGNYEANNGSQEHFNPYGYAEPQHVPAGYEPNNNIRDTFQAVQPDQPKTHKKKLRQKNRKKKKNAQIKVKNDTQNVHDSMVVRTINKSLKDLDACTAIRKPVEKTLEEIRGLIVESGHLSNDQAADALKVLDSIERNPNEHSVFQKTESDILNLVYNRIESFDDLEKKESLKRGLLRELADAVEYDHVVCSSGRTSHIVDALNHIDPKVNIKPGWCLSKELIDATNHVRKQHYDGLTDYEKMCVDSIDPNLEQEEFYKNFVSGVKNDVKTKFHKDYVEPGLVTESKLSTELNKWIDAAF